MSANSLSVPFPIFNDVDGDPLDAGYIYIGTANLDPETNPISVYFDEALTIPASQPIRTLNGFPSNSGSPARLYVNADDYSITVKNKNGSQVYTSPVSTDVKPISTMSGQLPAARVDFLQSGGVTRTQQNRGEDCVSAFDYMTEAQISGVIAGTYTGDLTTPVETAIATGKTVLLPGGTYLMNITIGNKVIIVGEGSTKTIVKPYNTAIAAMTYTSKSPYWTYHSEIYGVRFESASKVGVGFTFGKTNVADYVTNDEYANNVKFFGCEFKGFEKGIQFPFGNIGSEFYSCGFHGCKYGAYLRDNAGHGTMHAGNKYFYAGEFSSNDCAVYIHNTTSGFGAVTLNGTIIEGNGIALFYDNTAVPFVAVCFENVWLEANGYAVGGTFDVDQWSGTTLTTTTVTNANIIMHGSDSTLVVRGGFFTDAIIEGARNRILVENARVEMESGNGGNPCSVADNSSMIQLRDCWSNGKMTAMVDHIQVVGRAYKNQLFIDSAATSATNRPFITNHRKATISNYGSSKLKALDCFSAGAATTGNGSFSLTGSLVSDGVLFNQCTEFTRAAFTSSQYTALQGITNPTLTQDKFYVVTFDLKVTQGAIQVYGWNRSNIQFFGGVVVPANDRWYTFAAIGKSPTTQVLPYPIDFRGQNVDATWRISAVQLHEFDTLQDATEFLESGVYGY